jgi:hypothetical protein
MSFPPCYFHRHLYSFALIFLFLQSHATFYSFYSSATVHCKGERTQGGKPDRKLCGAGYHHHQHRGSGSAHHHKRVSSAAGGFVAGHRRTASGALIEVLDKMTGGALEMQQTTTDFLKDIQRQNQVIH